MSVQKHKCVVASQESSPVISLGWEEPVWGCLTLLPVCLGKEGGQLQTHAATPGSHSRHAQCSRGYAAEFTYSKEYCRTDLQSNTLLKVHTLKVLPDPVIR